MVIEASDESLKTLIENQILGRNRSVESNSTKHCGGRITSKRLQPCSYCEERHIWGKDRCKGFKHRCKNCGVFNHLEVACWYKFIEQPKPVENTDIKVLSDQEKHKAQNPPEDFSVELTDPELKDFEDLSRKENVYPGLGVKSKDPEIVNELDDILFAEVSESKSKSDDKDSAIKTENKANHKELQGFVHGADKVTDTMCNITEGELKCVNIDLSGKDNVDLEDPEDPKIDNNLLSGICGFQEDEKPIATVSYWSKIKENPYREKEAHPDKIVPDIDNHETSIEPTDIDLEQNKRFVEWLLTEIAKGNKEIFFDKVLGENILKNGGIVCEKYMEKKRELFC